MILKKDASHPMDSQKGTRRSITATEEYLLHKKKTKFLGHVSRRESLEKLIMPGKIYGQKKDKKSGEDRNTWMT